MVDMLWTQLAEEGADAGRLDVLNGWLCHDLLLDVWDVTTSGH